ncbi:MAG: tripartite tricarboxylate transporter substrate binding protein [Variovorax sp.]|nr:MAG: tripartite tricarboxylate transporter substrate binding protein [Variovorax sp.]
MRRRLFQLAILLAGIAAWPAFAQAQAWPAKPIRLVVPYTPAGGTDILGRMVGRRLSDALGVPVVIDNRPGSDGSIGTDIVAKSPPDGYTLLIDGTSQAYNVAFGKKLPYDSARDLAPIVQTANQQVLLLVSTRLPVKTVAELIDYARANPGKLSYGASSNANALPMELLKSMSGTNIVHVPYRGSGPMLNDLLGGQVELAMSGAAAPLPHVKAGKLRVLGIGDDQRSPSLPEFPTISEAGIPGFQTLQWSGLYAPQGTPRPVIERINREVLAILQDPVFRQQMVDAGFDVVSGPNTPEHWGALVASEVTKWSRIARMVGLKAD